MIKIVESEVTSFDTSKWADMVIGPARRRFLTPTGEHYRLLIHLAHKISDGVFYDVGTLDGASAIALGSNLSNLVTSWDISEVSRKTAGYAYPNVPGMDNIEFRTKSIFDEPAWIYDVADIICLDITPHDGIKERLFMEVLEKSNFKGLLICDDIRNRRFPNLSKWWDEINHPKWIIPYAHCSGTGIVSYGDETIVKGYPTVSHGIKGHLSRVEANWLNEMPARIGDGLYGELGTYRGRSAACIAGGIQTSGIKAHLITVDSYDGRSMTSGRPHSMEDTVACFKEKGISEYVAFMKGLTVPMADKCRSQRFDFLFIDADHSYEGCKADFVAWSPLVRSGGEIAFHDANLDSVLQVVKESGWKWYKVDTIAVVIKP